MRQLWYEELTEGETLSPLQKEPISRVQLAKYAGASGDFNALHLDHEFAAAAGLGDVIAHGMLSMAFLGQYAAQAAGHAGRVLSLQVTFRGMVRVKDVITVSGKVKGMQPAGDRGLVTLELAAVNQDGKAVTAGEATVALPRRGGAQR